jgi:solute carrier family 35 protein F1/2
MFVALCDVEGNYLAVKAFQHTSLTSVMLLDCFSIPSSMILSALLLGVRYSKAHYIGTFMCICGLVLVVLSDSLSKKGENDSSNDADGFLLGDLMVLASSILYAASNVGGEFMIKSRDYKFYLSRLGFFGSIISLIQLAVLEKEELISTTWNFRNVGLISIFVLALLLMYILTSVFLGKGDAGKFLPFMPLVIYC